MTECTCEHFVQNGLLKPVSEFPAQFSSDRKYIYEVFRAQKRVPVFIEDHLERLWHTAALENLILPFTHETVMASIFRLIGSNPEYDGNIKIYVSHNEGAGMNCLVYFTPHQYPTPEQFKNGVAVKLLHARRNNPNAKIMDTVLRRTTEKIKADEDVNEVLFVDPNGYITEGSRSNVFFISNSSVITPPLYQVLEGVTRKQVIELGKSAQIQVSEKLVHSNDLPVIDGAFITGTSRRILPVKQIDNIELCVDHPVVRKLQRLLENRVEEYISGFSISM